MIQTSVILQDLIIEDKETVSKKCCCFDKKQNNIAIVKNKKLYSLFEITGAEALEKYYIEVYKNSYNNDYYLWEDLNFVCNNLGYIGGGITIDKLINVIENYKYIGYEGLKKFIQEKENNNQFINVVEIKILELGGSTLETINHYIQYRNDFYAKREIEEQEKARLKAEKEQEETKIKQLEIENMIMSAEQQILSNEKVFNNEIEVLNKNNEVVETSLLLHLFKYNNINIPLKTQGWINKSLQSIFISEHNNKYTYNYIGNNSTVAKNYILELVEVIKNKNNIALSSDEIEAKQLEQEKQEYINNIKVIDFKKEYNSFKTQMEINILKKENGLHIFNLQEQEELAKRIFKALKYENIKNHVDNYMKLESILDDGTKNKITLSKNNTNISVIGIKSDNKLKLYFSKWFENKNDVYIYIEVKE